MCGDKLGLLATRILVYPVSHFSPSLLKVTILDPSALPTGKFAPHCEAKQRFVFVPTPEKTVPCLRLI